MNNSRSSLKRTKREIDRNNVESVEDIRKETKPIVKNEAMDKMVRTAWEQLLGPKKNGKKNGELREGEFVELSKARIEPLINYAAEIVNASERSERKENHQLKIKIEEIVIELKKISKSSKQLEATVRDVNIDLIPEDPGKYHLNFFEWMLMALQTARVRVEESANWASAVVGKRAKKDFWSLSKKHGTSYQLSGERVVSQQVG